MKNPRAEWAANRYADEAASVVTEFRDLAIMVEQRIMPVAAAATITPSLTTHTDTAVRALSIVHNALANVNWAALFRAATEADSYAAEGGAPDA